MSVRRGKDHVVKVVEGGHYKLVPASNLGPERLSEIIARRYGWLSRARSKLEQCRSRALPGLLALLTNQPPREVVNACRRHMRQRAKINVARCLAARALDLQPWEAAIDCLIYRRRWIDGAAIGPHALIPALTGEVVGFPDQRLALAPLFRRPLGENARHGPALGEFLRQRLAVAAGQRGGVMFRSHSANLARRRYAHGCGGIRARRAASRNRPADYFRSSPISRHSQPQRVKTTRLTHRRPQANVGCTPSSPSDSGPA